MAKLGTVALGMIVGAAALGAAPAEARACGGCFVPTDNPTVVTDHRMIMTIAKDESTLYDQIKYSGDPSSFAWVLPYSGEIKVGLSADVVFTALDSLTQTTILPPPGCGSFNNPNAGASSGGSSGTSGQSSGGSDGVTVIKHEVVGPYDTVQLAATNPKALEDWLKANQFVIPGDVQPVVDQYVEEHFNFLALRLVPNKGIQDMRPVRVTTKGASIALPLRMVAAGTGSTVGISLWVIGEGRYEPQNYGSFVIDDNDLGWDVPNQTSNYKAVRAALTAKGNNSVWEIESSTFLNTNQLYSTVVYSSGNASSSGASGQNGVGDDYLPEKDGAGNITKTATQVREEDLDLLMPADAATRVTRMRADLAHTALSRDLLLTASQDQSLLSNTHQLFRCGLPGDPSSTIIRPGDNAVPATSSGSVTPSAQPAGGSGDGTFTCNTGRANDRAFGTVGFSILGLALARAIRRRRK